MRQVSTERDGVEAEDREEVGLYIGKEQRNYNLFFSLL